MSLLTGFWQEYWTFPAAEGRVRRMTRAHRLARILTILRAGGGPHRAEDLAARLGVSPRTLYRDMDRLVAAGVPVEGTRGRGYHLADMVALPPVLLTADELEALQLGIAIVAQADDPDLRDAAERLADKIDAALPEEGVAAPEAWHLGSLPRPDAARVFALIGTLRSAIRGRQKLDLVYAARGDDDAPRRVRPLRLDHAGRIWTLLAWCESTGDFALFRVDLIARATPLPELFVEEEGKRARDYR